jgi:hypothetical protein
VAWQEWQGELGLQVLYWLAVRQWALYLQGAVSNVTLKMMTSSFQAPVLLMVAHMRLLRVLGSHRALMDHSWLGHTRRCLMTATGGEQAMAVLAVLHTRAFW